MLTAAEMESQMRTQKCPLAWLIKEAKLKSEGAPGAGEPDQQGAQDLLGCIIFFLSMKNTQLSLYYYLCFFFVCISTPQ